MTSTYSHPFIFKMSFNKKPLNNKIAPKKVTNAFDILSNDSDSEGEDYPVIKIIKLVTETENKKWCDIVKNSKPWYEYEDSDSDDDAVEKYKFKPVHPVTFSGRSPNRKVRFADEH